MAPSDPDITVITSTTNNKRATSSTPIQSKSYPFTVSEPETIRWEDSSNATAGLDRDTEMDHKTGEIIHQLCRSGGNHPAPVPEPTLQAAISRTGIPHFNPELVPEYKQRVCNYLDLAWDEQQQRYVCTVDTPLVQRITTLAEAITTHLDDNVPSELQAEIDTWCDTHDLTDLEHPLDELAHHAAFSLLLKVARYRHYFLRGDIPTPLKTPRSDLQTAREVTDDPAFEENVLDKLIWLVDEATITPVLQGRHLVTAVSDPATMLGRIFDAVTGFTHREAYGQFRTPANMSTVMRTWVTDTSRRLLDPGMGSAILSTHPRSRVHTPDVARASVTGVDRPPLATLMGSTALLLNGQRHHVHQTNFFDLSPEDIEYNITGVVMNPPYISHDDLATDEKARLNEQLSAETGLDLRKDSPLHAYFVYHTAQFLSDGNRASFLTPHNVLDTEAGEHFKAFLQREFDIIALVLWNPHNDSLFENAAVTSLFSFVEKSAGNDPSGATRIIRIDELPRKDELLAAIDGDVDGDPDWGVVESVEQAQLCAGDDWTRLFQPNTPEIELESELGDIATIQRADSTGKTSVFCLSQSTVDRWDIADQHLTPLLRKESHAPHFDYTDADWQHNRDDDNEVWVLTISTDLASVPDCVEDALAEHPSWTPTAENTGEAAGVRSYLAATATDDDRLTATEVLKARERWYCFAPSDSPPVVVTAATRGDDRFIRNKAGLPIINNVYAMYLDVELTDQELRALLGYLNSSIVKDVVEGYGRTAASGLNRHSKPKRLEMVPTPDPRELTDSVVDDLARSFDRLCEAKRSGQDIDELRQEIDQVLQTVLFD